MPQALQQTGTAPPEGELQRLPATDLQALLDALLSRGYAVKGPVLQDQAVAIGDLTSATQLPQGVVDTQAPGSYRVQHTGNPHFFAFNAGADSWKSLLFPSRRLLFEFDADLIATTADQTGPAPMAFLGVRACDLAAVDIQHKVFAATDPSYGRKLEAAFVIGVHCQTAAATCFCPSTGTGPEFLHPQWLDLLLTEICDGDDHYFLLQPHSSSGAELVEELPLQPAEPADAARITQQLQNTRSRIDKTLPGNAYEVLSHAQQSPQWDAVAERCLACGNCTYVCPTCFCSDVEDHTDVTGTAAQRWQVWDSCFNAGHSYTHAGVVRNTTRARYRQWLTHKLATWHEQFGTSGCVGCGRCVTWCPVGIDLTQEVAALSAAQDHEH